MTDTENIKSILGDSARDIIVQDLALNLRGEMVCCPFPEHYDKKPSCQWKGDAFHCYTCSKQYDIFEHYQTHKGLSFPESLEELAKMSGHIIRDDYIKPRLRRKTTVSVKPEYTEKLNKLKYEANKSEDYLSSKNISHDVATKMYWCQSSTSEIFFKHFEFTNKQWVECFSKRRQLSGENYKFEDVDVKEFSLPGGQQCFFGLQTLFNSKNEFKSYAIITEGHTDCLRTMTASVEEGLDDIYAVLSVPNGSGSLKTALENSPTFTRWLKKAKGIIFIPDFDEAGKKLIFDAKEYLPNQITKWCDLSKVTERIKDKTDVSDLLDCYQSIESILAIQEPVHQDGCTSLRDIGVKDVEHGINSGFATLDWNDSGLKMGGFTIITGFRGMGKTTLVRQMIAAAAMQGEKCFCWFGEGSVESEKSRFARLCSTKGCIESYQNEAGRTIFKPSQEMIDDFDDTIADKITLYKMTSDVNVDPFDDMIDKMKYYASCGHKIFMIDNLMVLTSSYGAGGKELAAQKRIVASLKVFALEYGVHVLLLAHPKKGEGFQSVGGSGNIENTCDTLLRYVRVKGDAARQMSEASELPCAEVENISAVVLNEKVRDEGEDNIMFLEWDSTKGMVRDVAYIPGLRECADRYEKQGFFSRSAKEIYL